MFSLTLLTIAGMMTLAVRYMKATESAAFAWLAEPKRYSETLRPTDLIHIGEFIRAWIRPAH